MTNTTPFPVVTVVVTVFGRTTFLRQAIDSALAQTFTPFEVLVTDDADSEAVREICRAYSAESSLRYRSNKAPLGIALNLRAAIEEARGRYVAVLNDDDAWEPSFLERLVSRLEQDRKLAVAFSDHWIMRADGSVDRCATEENSRRYGRSDLPAGIVNDPAHLVLEKNGVPLAMAAVLRKESFDWTMLTSEVAGAYDFWIACVLAAVDRRFFYVPERLTRYRTHAASETALRRVDKNRPLVFIFEQLLQRGWFPTKRSLLLRCLAEARYRLGLDALWFGQSGQARKHFRSALPRGPWWKVIVATVASFAPQPVRQSLGLAQPRELKC